MTPDLNKIPIISWDIDNNVPLPYLNPDCRDGKHQACAGDAWNFETDEPIDCMCHCHIKKVTNVNANG